MVLVSKSIDGYGTAKHLPMMTSNPSWQPMALGLIGAAVGGCIGHFAFMWIATMGFYALVIPPAFLGWGAGLAARVRSVPLATGCAIAGFVLALFSEWRLRPFTADSSFSYLLTHVHRLEPMTLIMVGLGTFFSYRMALGSDRNG